ncbi:MAG: Fur family transcriptional regulator [Spirochaetota bacterium]
MEQYKQYLEEKGISPSYQRLKILEYLDQNRTHPTVDEIYTALVPHIPTLSKTTVYNTLSLFVQEGLASMLVLDNVEARFDITVQPHGHFTCKKCGKVYDIDINRYVNMPKSIDGHIVEQYQITFKGICKDCSSH